MNELIKKDIKLLKSGYSMVEVAKINNRNYKTVEGVKRAYKDLIGEVKNHKRNFANHDYFDNIDNEIKAYLLGFFLADGSLDGSTSKNGIYSKRMMIQNSIDDEQIVKIFNDKICPKSKLYYKNNQDGVKFFRKTQCSLRWSSDHMTNILINKYNFCRRKAYNKEFYFPFETIPKKLIRHFIRGFFDGDGNVDFKLVNQRNSEKRTHRFQYGFICNSYPFAKQLSDIICSISRNVSGTISEIDGKTTNWFVLRFNMNGQSEHKRYVFYKYLYKNATIYLDRKKKKFDDFFEYRGKQLV